MGEKTLARALREEFVPKIARRLPGHHLNGFKHDFIVNTVKKHKGKHPYFLRADITKFYPSIRHRDLVAGIQVAYRDLCAMDYVPEAFKKRFVGAVNAWCCRLPLQRGIPLGSPLSAIAAPVMLIPVWLQLKKQFKVPFIVFMDDVLVMCESAEQVNEVYAFLVNTLLGDYELNLNLAKTRSGRFSRDTVDFCGWRFAGGYAAISEEKVEAFKERVATLARRDKKGNMQAFIKRMNQAIDGFGHYYKHGDTARQFEALDVYIRGLVRRRLTGKTRTGTVRNSRLDDYGLHSLTRIFNRHQDKMAGRTPGASPRPGRRLAALPNPARDAPARSPTAAWQDTELLQRVADHCDKIQSQLTQLLALHRKLLRAVERFSSP
ncbi:MAG: hypothetical protein LBQ65_06245 [Tannerellaceae bacterium]|nr:hypothetical protein [Tannerellaceae bacterium]